MDKDLIITCIIGLAVVAFLKSSEPRSNRTL